MVCLSRLLLCFIPQFVVRVSDKPHAPLARSAVLDKEQHPECFEQCSVLVHKLDPGAGSAAHNLAVNRRVLALQYALDPLRRHTTCGNKAGRA